VTPASPRRRWPPALEAAAFGAAGLLVLLVAGWALGRWTLAWDRAILLALREPGNIAVPIGPAWGRRFLTDVTALGGGPLVTLVVTGVTGLLLVQRHRLTAVLTAAASITGSLMVDLLKNHVARARPDVVPHLIEVQERSFPSGHATSSAVMYLTMAGLASQVIRDRAARTYVIVCAMLLTGLIGFSRVYLGVHWPSDVLAGWCFGTLWALGWWRLGAGARAVLRDGR